MFADLDALTRNDAKSPLLSRRQLAVLTAHSPSARVTRRVAGARRRGRCCSMTKKPSEPSEPTSRNVYKAVKKAVRLGTVEAPDKSSAIEKAAQEFKAEAWRLYAVPRR